MTLDFQQGRARVEQRYPFFRSTNFERRMLFERLQGGQSEHAFSRQEPTLVADPVRLAR